jgi:hypothetical protein
LGFRCHLNNLDWVFQASPRNVRTDRLPYLAKAGQPRSDDQIAAIDYGGKNESQKFPPHGLIAAAIVCSTLRIERLPSHHVSLVSYS